MARGPPLRVGSRHVIVDFVIECMCARRNHDRFLRFPSDDDDDDDDGAAATADDDDDDEDDDDAAMSEWSALEPRSRLGPLDGAAAAAVVVAVAVGSVSSLKLTRRLRTGGR